MKTLAVALMVALALSAPAFARAQVLDFGGWVLSIPIPCTCTAGTSYYIPMMLITPYPGPGAVVYTPPGLILDAFNLLYASPGVGVIGQFAPGHLCLFGVAPYCYAPPALGTIIQEGSSLAPQI